VDQAFRPVFVNRLDAIVAFQPLSDTDLAQIAKAMLNKFQTRLKTRGIELEVTQEAVDWICSQGARCVSCAALASRGRRGRRESSHLDAGPR